MPSYIYITTKLKSDLLPFASPNGAKVVSMLNIIANTTKVERVSAFDSKYGQQCKWKELPFQFETDVNVGGHRIRVFYPVNFSLSQNVQKFAPLLRVRAPPVMDWNLERAPIGLVTVLDVSGNMNGTKLTLLKKAMCLVIENLGPFYQLSIVTFSSIAHRSFPVMMDYQTRASKVVLAINGISLNCGIEKGLKMGGSVLEERHEKNLVVSIILLSDGRDTNNGDTVNQHNINQNLRSSKILIPYLNQLPSSIRSCNRQRAVGMSTFPGHTFEFGSDNNSSALYAIADASRGTYLY
ncbi:hypothetical protein RDI58_004095 [Solanum bulbocastanum]|uniref:VWFA domain-containing protein n=1 Tax=Solanum bulbocastanum TaxID=147425 RepID=A0AAN8U0J4_SOLBU